MSRLHAFQSRFDRFGRVRRRLLNSALAYRLAAGALAAGVAGLLLLSGWLPNAFVNLGLFAALAVFLLVVAGVYLRRRQRAQSPLAEAFHIEKLAGSLNSRLVSAWDFLQLETPTPLTEAVIRTAEGDLNSPFEELLDRQDRNLRRKRFAAALVLFVGLALTPWFGLNAVNANFWRSLAAARDILFPIEFVVTPNAGSHVHRLGEKVEIALEFSRPGVEEVELVLQQGDAEPTRTRLAVDPQGRVQHTLTSDLEVEYDLHFEFAARRSEPLRIIFTTPPTLVNMQTEMIAPNYTRQLPRTLEGVQQRLLGLPGTRMTLGFTFSKELASATLTWDDGQTLPLDAVGRFASIGLIHNTARQASLQVVDQHGFALDYPLVINFDLQADEAPQILLPKHLTEDMPLLPEAAALFGFGVRAQDDYGVTRCILSWQKSSVDNPTNVVERGEIERLVAPAERKVLINFEKVFESLSLQPGDKLSFTVLAIDNRDPKKQTSRSRRCSFFIFQEELGGLTIKELGFGGAADGQARIAKATRATMVKSPEGRRNAEKVRNEHQAEVASAARAPTVRGEFGQATRDYFRLLSGVEYQRDKKKTSTASDEQTTSSVDVGLDLPEPAPVSNDK